MAETQTINLDQMRSDIYQQLKEAYKEHPETLSPGAKAVLGIMATTQYMDHYDRKGDLVAAMATRLEIAEKLMYEMEAGVYKGPGEPSNMICLLVPTNMVETTEGYSEMRDLAARMHKVLDRNAVYSLHHYEEQKGLPLTDTRHPMDHLAGFEGEEVGDALLED